MRVSRIDVVSDRILLALFVQFSNILLNLNGWNDSSFFNINGDNKVDVIPAGVKACIKVSDSSTSLNFGAQGLSVVFEVIPVESCRKINISASFIVNTFAQSKYYNRYLGHRMGAISISLPTKN